MAQARLGEESGKLRGRCYPVAHSRRPFLAPTGSVVRKVIADGFALAERVKRRYQEQRKTAGTNLSLSSRVDRPPEGFALTRPDYDSRH